MSNIILFSQTRRKYPIDLKEGTKKAGNQNRPLMYKLKHKNISHKPKDPKILVSKI